MGFEASVHPFKNHAAFAPLRELPLEELVAKLRGDSALRERLLGERRWDPVAAAEWQQPCPNATGPEFAAWMDYALTRLYRQDRTQWQRDTLHGCGLKSHQ